MKVHVYMDSPMGHSGYSFVVRHNDKNVVLMDFCYSVLSASFYLRLFKFEEYYNHSITRFIRKRLGGHHGLSKMANGFVKRYGVDSFYNKGISRIESMVNIICRYIKRHGYIEGIDWSKEHHRLDYWNDGWNSNYCLAIKDNDEDEK